MPEPGLLVLGVFPPVPGPATAATVALVRDELRSGTQVTTAAARPGGAQLVARVTGPLAGWRLEQLRRQTGADRLTLAVTDGVPARRASSAAQRVAAAVATRSLAWGLRRYASVTLLLADDPGVGRAGLAPLWSAADSVVVADPSLVGVLGVPATKVRPLDAGAPLRGLAGSGVTALGPAEVTPLAVPRYTLGVVGRRVLGRRFMWWYSRVMRTINLGRRVKGKLRRSLAR